MKKIKEMYIKKTKTLAVVLVGLVSISFMSAPVGAWMWHTDTVYLGSAHGGYFEMQIYKSFWGDEVEGRFYFWNYPYSQTMVIPDGYLGKARIECDGPPIDEYTFVDKVSRTIRSGARGADCGAIPFSCGEGSAVCFVAGLADGPSPAVDFFCLYWVSKECAWHLLGCLLG
ncbi:MAG: hypothetical protein HXS48_25490 [Theionarchaea archaeon]|nr:hypothetical protein [Theionarchaea archaeon]